MAQGQCRPCQPRSVEGDVGDRELPNGGARRTCLALREVYAQPDLVQLLQGASSLTARSRENPTGRRHLGSVMAKDDLRLDSLREGLKAKGRSRRKAAARHAEAEKGSLRLAETTSFRRFESNLAPSVS